MYVIYMCMYIYMYTYVSFVLVCIFRGKGCQVYHFWVYEAFTEILHTHVYIYVYVYMSTYEIKNLHGAHAHVMYVHTYIHSHCS